MNKSRTIISIEEFSSTLTYIELVLIGTIMMIICAVTAIGNALVLVSFALDKKLRTLSNYFLLSLAVSDIMIAIFSMPLFIAYLLIGEWTLGPVVCDIWLAQDYTCSNASGLNLLMIGFDRYFSVTSPLKYRARKNGKSVGIMISCVWIIAFLLWPPWIYAWPYIEGRRTVPEDDCYIQFLETNSYLTIFTAIIDYYIPVTIMIVLYYKIWRETRNRRKFLADMATRYQSESPCLQSKLYSVEACNEEFPMKSLLATHVNNNRNNFKLDDEADKNATERLLEATTNQEEDVDSIEAAHRCKWDTAMSVHTELQISPSGISEVHLSSSKEINESKKTSSSSKGNAKPDDKAARVLTSILLAFLITTTPYNVLVIVKNLDSTHSVVPDSLWNFVWYLFYVNSTLNPLCYALANENFRKTYWQILTCSWSKKSKYAVAMSSYSDKSSHSDNSSKKFVTSFS